MEFHAWAPLFYFPRRYLNLTTCVNNLHYEKFQDGTVKCIEDEIPFEVPEGWAWTRFSAITINRDSERKPISSSQRTDVAKIYDYYGASGKIDKIDKYIC